MKWRQSQLRDLDLTSIVRLPTMAALGQAISKVDEIVALLESGALGGAPAAPAAAPPAAAAAKAKKEKPPKAGGVVGGPPATPEALFAKARLAVARVDACEPHHSSAKLYITRLDVGGGEARQVVAGLQQHVAASDLLGSLVCVVLNLKAARLAGEASEGMILAAAEGDRVALVRPPAGAAPGAVLFLEGVEPDAALYAKTLKGEHWRAIAAELCVAGGGAAFAGRALVTAGGALAAADMPDGAEIR
jgi:aminoacyl tRNA synthase complex-interacting multifunctional protein 1